MPKTMPTKKLKEVITSTEMAMEYIIQNSKKQQTTLKIWIIQQLKNTYK